MEYQDHLPNIESEEAMTNAIKNMQTPACDVPDHLESKDQICVDEACDEKSE